MRVNRQSFIKKDVRRKRRKFIQFFLHNKKGDAAVSHISLINSVHEIQLVELKNENAIV